MKILHYNHLEETLFYYLKLFLFSLHKHIIIFHQVSASLLMFTTILL